MFYDLVYWLGAWQVCWWAYRWLNLAYQTFFGTPVSVERYGRDTWAIVTGSTDGIGKAQALNLARRGFNIVLISRSIDKLNSVAKEI